MMLPRITVTHRCLRQRCQHCFIGNVVNSLAAACRCAARVVALTVRYAGKVIADSQSIGELGVQENSHALHDFSPLLLNQLLFLVVVDARKFAIGI